MGCFGTHRFARSRWEPANRTGPSTRRPLWPMFPLIRAGPTPRVAMRPRRGGCSARSAFSTSLRVTTSSGTPSQLPSLRSPEPTTSAPGPTNGWCHTPATTSSSAAARRTTGPSTTTWAPWRHRSGTTSRLSGTSAKRSRCMSGSVPRAGCACTERALAELPGTDRARNDFRLEDGRWLVSFAGRRVSLPDAKGLRDLHALVGASGREVHVLDLLGPEVAGVVGRSGSDAVLDAEAKARYRVRLDQLADELDSAERAGDADRAEALESERTALVHELARNRPGRSRPPSRRCERAGSEDRRGQGEGQLGQARAGPSRARRPPAPLGPAGHLMCLPPRRTDRLAADDLELAAG